MAFPVVGRKKSVHHLKHQIYLHANNFRLVLSNEISGNIFLHSCHTQRDESLLGDSYNKDIACC
jgi:hypothetical protein